MRLSTISIFCFLLVLLEVIAQTYLAAYGSKDLAAILYLMAGLGIGLYPLLAYRSEGGRLLSTDLPRSANWLVFALLTSAIFYFGWQALQSQPLDYTFADMLPIIQIMAERWLAGQEVYAVIPEIWDGMQPIYLPVMWLAYVPAILLGLDIRITNLLLLVFVSVLVLEPWRASSWERLLLKLSVLVPLLAYVLYCYTTFITISEEPVVVACYAVLGYAVLREKRLLLVVALVGCVLSRYTLIFWAVTYFGYLLWQRDYRRVLPIVLGAGALGLLVMVMSQGIYQLELFYSLKDGYLDSFQDPELAWRTKNAVAKNIGMARFFAFDQLLHLHRALFWVSLVLPLLLFAWYHWRLRARKVPVQLFGICSLKLCLVYFFNFNAIPYSYLFYTSTFLSVILFSQLIHTNYFRVQKL